MIEKFGADALRLYVMFVAPPGEGDRVDRRRPGGQLPLPGAGVAAGRSAVRNDRRRGHSHSWRADTDDAERALRRKTHETIRRVTLDLDPRVHLNTAVSGSDGAGQRGLCLLRRERLRARSAGDGRRRRGRRPVTRRDGRGAEGSDRGAGPDAVAVRAAHGRGAVGAARARRRHQRGRLAGASARRSPGHAEIIVPVQVNGKVRRAGSRSPPTSRTTSCARHGACRSAGGAPPGRQDRAQGRHRGRQRLAWSAWWRHEDEPTVLAAVRPGGGWPLPGLRLLAVRPRLVPAGVDQDHRRAALHQHHQPVRDRAACHRPGARGAHRPRPLDRHAGSRPASTRC